MRPLVERQVVAHLAAGELDASQIAGITKIPRSTVRDWLRQPTPKKRQCRVLRLELDTIPRRAYSYLLGFYLGDGNLSHSRGDVYRLRIKTDARYPAIIGECAAAMQAVMSGNRVYIQQMPYRAVEISCYSKRWPLLFPQHGRGRKHERKIELVSWQEKILGQFPREFLRGLIHSDGCRVLNRVDGKDYPRYLFKHVCQWLAPEASPSSTPSSARRHKAGCGGSHRMRRGRRCRRSSRFGR